ncbi:MAG: FAD:protein FMN transferase, partial [Bacteroidetes bacterium]|nr:FAD:protein FMN transferase [Bacteroidota bacterium]
MTKSLLPKEKEKFSQSRKGRKENKLIPSPWERSLRLCEKLLLYEQTLNSILRMPKFPHKSKIYPLVLILVMVIVYYYRKSRNQPVEINGTTMGTYYSIKYFGKGGTIFKKEIDLLLVDFNNALSTYIAESEISLFNNNDSIHKFSSTYFYPVLQKSKEVYLATNGAFDPTVMPLVNA